MNRSPATLVGKRGAVLVRVSSDAQETASQERAMRQFLTHHKLTVGEADWYVEQGRSRLERHKSKELPLLNAAVENGQYDYIVTFVQNRGGYKHDFEFSEWCNFLINNGCELWDTEVGILNDPDDMATRVITVIGNQSSTKSLKEHAMNVVRGKVHHAREGKYFGGLVPYGFDVGIYDKAGVEKWRVVVVESRRIPHPNPRSKHKHQVITTFKKVWPDGREEVFEGSWPAYEETDDPKYVRSNDPYRLGIVEKIFNWYAAELWSFNAIARELTRQGVKPYYGVAWQGVQVQNMLANPIYIGKPTFGKTGEGAKLVQFIGGEYKPVEWKRNRPQPVKKKSAEDHVGPDEENEIVGIIGPDLWLKVQERLAGHKTRPVPRQKGQWLAGLVYCATCGLKMISSKANPASRKKAYFICQNFKTHFGNPPTPCGRNHVHAEVLERLVEEYLAEVEVTAETLVQAQANPELLKPFLERYQAEQGHLLQAHKDMLAYIAGQLEQGENRVSVSPDLPPVHVLVEGDDVKVLNEEVGTYDVYQHLYRMGQSRIINEIADLERQREDLYERMKGYKSDFARKKADEEMDSLSSRIEELQGQRVRHDQNARLAYQRLLEVQRDIREARIALAGDVHRRKAEAVRKVLGKVVCHFERHDRGTRRNVHADKLVKVELLPAQGTALRGKVCDTFNTANIHRNEGSSNLEGIIGVALTKVVFLYCCTEAKVPDLLTVAQAGKILGVCPATVRLWEAAGRLSSVRTAGGHRRYRREDVGRLAAK